MLSFIIPAHNEEQCLPSTIGALHAAGRACAEEYEIVVADDASADRTAAIARSLGARVVSIEARHISAARNAGARAALGDLFIFVDADTIVPPATAVAALRALRGGVAGGGSMVRFDPPVPFWAAALMPVFMIVYRSMRLAAGCFLFCTREAFEKVGGFDESVFASEEVWMSRALKQHGRFVSLRQHVTTSGRKLRLHSAREIIGICLRFGLRGISMVRTRDGLDLWYGPRRHDPNGPAAGAESLASPAAPAAREG